MISITIIIFILAAILGLILIAYLLRNKETPKGLAFVHGSIAALGILLLIVSFFIYPVKPYISLVCFILAATGGVTMMYRDITGKQVPKWLAIGHGTIAVIGFIFLVIYAFYSL